MGLQRLFVCLTVLVLLLAAAAQAATIPSDVLSITDPNKNVVARLSLFEDGTVTCEGPLGCQQTGPVGTPEDAGLQIYFFTGVPIDETQVTVPTVLLEDPATISDVVGIMNVGGALVFGFISFDIPLTDIGLPPDSILVNEPGDHDVSRYMTPSLQSAGFTATFTSDGDAVPEPATMSLVGVAAVGLLLLRRRLQRHGN